MLKLTTGMDEPNLVVPLNHSHTVILTLVILRGEINQIMLKSRADMILPTVLLY